MSGSPDLIVSAIALAATLVALASVRRAGGGTALAGKLAALLGGLALLLAARLLAWTGVGAAAVPLMIVAGWLPLLALLVAEGLVRRHAPAWLKWTVLAGAGGFTVAAITLGVVWDGAVLAALTLFQAAATLAIVVLLLRRRVDVTPAEARAAAIFAAALTVAVPLTATDFRDLVAVPVRGGGFAALILVFAITRFVAGTATWRALAIDVAATAGGGAIVALGAAAIWPDADAARLLQAGAIGAATTALALIVQRRGEARLVARARPTIVAALAGLPDRPSLDAVLAAHPLLSSGRLLGDGALADYPPAVLAALAGHRVVTRAHGDGARDLLDAQAATHLVRLSARPPHFLAVSAGGLAGEGTAAELDMVARIAEGAR